MNNNKPVDKDELARKAAKVGKKITNLAKDHQVRLADAIANNPNGAELLEQISAMIPDAEPIKKDKKRKREDNDFPFLEFYEQLRQGVVDYRDRVAKGDGKLELEFFDQIDPAQKATQLEEELKNQGKLLENADEKLKFLQTKLTSLSEDMQQLEKRIGDAQRFTLYHMLYEGAMLWAAYNISASLYPEKVASWLSFHKVVVVTSLYPTMSYSTMDERIKLYKLYLKYPVVLESGVSPTKIAKNANRLLEYAKEFNTVHAFLAGEALRKADGSFVLTFAHFKVDLNNNRGGWNKKMLTKATPNSEKKSLKEKKQEDEDAMVIDGLEVLHLDEPDAPPMDNAENMNVEQLMARVQQLEQEKKENKAMYAGNYKELPDDKVARSINGIAKNASPEKVAEYLKNPDRLPRVIDVILAKPSNRYLIWEKLTHGQLINLLSIVPKDAWGTSEQNKKAHMEYQKKLDELKEAEARAKPN